MHFLRLPSLRFRGRSLRGVLHLEAGAGEAPPVRSRSPAPDDRPALLPPLRGLRRGGLVREPPGGCDVPHVRATEGGYHGAVDRWRPRGRGRVKLARLLLAALVLLALVVACGSLG